MDEYKKIRQGNLLCNAYKEKYFQDSSNYLVFLFSPYMEFNKCTLELLPLLRKKKKISKMVIISHKEGMAEVVGEHLRINYEFVECTGNEAELISLYCRMLLDLNQQPIIINDSGCREDDRIFEVLGYNGISMRDLVALSVFKFNYIPNQEEVEASIDFEVPRYKKIDWKRAENKVRKIKRNHISLEERIELGINPILENCILKKDKIILFSVTNSTRYLLERMQEYEIVAILDNDKTKTGTFLCGVPIFAPEDFLVKKHEEDYKIIVPTRSYKYICEQLAALGYEINKQVFISYIDVDYSIQEQHISLKQELTEGKKYFEQIELSYPSIKKYICPYPGTGDMYLIGMYLKDRMAYDHVSECILIVSSKACSKIFSLFSIEDVVKDIIVLPNRTESLKLLSYIKARGYEACNYTLLNDSYSNIDLQWVRGYKGLDFNTFFQKTVFYAPCRRGNCEINQIDSTKIFEENSFRAGKTILLSPYANTIASVHTYIWEKIAERLSDMGYDVCTNISGTEQPIKGTTGVFIPYNQIVDFLNRAGGFIGIRSGLCDIISSCTVKKVILYPSEVCFFNTTNLIYFSLEKMGIAQENIIELEFEQDNQEQIINRTLEVF